MDIFDIEDKELLYCSIVVAVYLFILFNPFR